MYQVIMGIDPGKHGALACLHVKTGSLLHAIPRPEAIQFTYTWLTEMQRRYEDELFIAMEQAHGNPVQGFYMTGKAAFTYGREFGHLEAAISCGLKIPMQLIPPQSWTSELHKGCYEKEAKAKSLEVARRLWPDMQFKFSEKAKKAHDGLVDAMLIAEYMRRRLKGD